MSLFLKRFYAGRRKERKKGIKIKEGVK